jgi:hypothetical protein
VADPEVDVVAEVGAEVTAVGQDVQGDAREGEGGGDVLWGYSIISITSILMEGGW